jgi:hypothetical protein
MRFTCASLRTPARGRSKTVHAHDERPRRLPARNGTIKVHGDSGSDEVRFEATFRRDGSAKGYLSLWYYQLGLSSEGKLVSDPFLGASNWTAKRVGR